MNLETQKDENLTRYLLGDMTNEERERVEERFLQDDSYFEEMLALEDELMYEYKRGNLTAKEEQLFEKRFLSTKQDKQKSVFADAFLKTIDGLATTKQEETKAAVVAAPIPFWKSLSAFFSFQSSALQLGMTAAMFLLLLGSAWLFVKNNQLKNDVATLKEQTEDQNRLKQEIEDKQRQKEELEIQLAKEKGQSELNQEQIRKLEEERTRLEKEIQDRRNQQTPKTSPPQNRTSVFATLIPGLVRSGSTEMQSVRLTESTRLLSLQLKLKPAFEYMSYQATLRNIENDAEVWKSHLLKARGNGKNKTVSFQLPVNNLQNAQYEISLEGINENGTREQIDDYYFRVVKPQR